MLGEITFVEIVNELVYRSDHYHSVAFQFETPD